MTSRQLPERPNLEQLKKQAKTLLHAARAKHRAALQRFLALPAFAKRNPDQLGPQELALHDAQSVIAREHGFPSWKALREHVEEHALTFEAAVEEFLRAATGGAPDRAKRLLKLHPRIAHANLHTALVLGDAEHVAMLLRDAPAFASERGGPHGWEPIHYVCHNCLCGEDPARAAGLVAIARQLLALGANPNATYQWQWHPELPRTVLWAALCVVGHLPLAAALLAAGADPTDGVSAHITAGNGNLEALELLHRFGLNVNGIPGGVPPLVYMLGWATDSRGARWLLEHGADPNLAWGEAGEAPLHVAARRWDVALVELLVRHGADVNRRRADGRTAHTLAELHGNHAIAAWLLDHGAVDELSPLERFIAACARGDRATAEAMLRAHPSLRAELQTEHHLMLHGIAERGDAAVLETMLACGFDPGVRDRDGITALHRAAMAGHADAVRVLLRFGAPIDALDHTFAASPLIWAVEGWSHAGESRTDHPRVARLLIDAGCSTGWTPPPGAPSPERTFEQLAALRRAAALSSS